MIDLHAHALALIDDGPRSIDDAVQLCAAAAADGTKVMIATPHINFDYPDLDGPAIRAAGQTLRAALNDAGIALDLRVGAEVALGRAVELSDDELRTLSLGGGPTLLLELPWEATATGMAAAVRRVADRGFRLLLAHPERTPVLRDDERLVRELVEDGACCCLNAISLSRQSPRHTREAAQRLLSAGLVHAIASDAHDLAARRPELRSPLREAGLSSSQIAYFTEEGPRALLWGRVPPAPPAVGGPSRRRLSWRAR